MEKFSAHVPAKSGPGEVGLSQAETARTLARKSQRISPKCRTSEHFGRTLWSAFGLNVHSHQLSTNRHSCHDGSHSTAANCTPLSLLQGREWAACRVAMMRAAGDSKTGLATRDKRRSENGRLASRFPGNFPRVIGPSCPKFDRLWYDSLSGHDERLMSRGRGRHREGRRSPIQ